MNHEIAIVGHHHRGMRATKLGYRVGAKINCTDDGRIGAGYNHLRAWRWLGANNHQKWSVVLEDDALPVPNFNEQLTKALEHAPSQVVSLYLGAGSPRHWQPSISSVIARPESWLMADELLHHVGVAIHTSVCHIITDVRAMLDDYPIDEAIGLQCRALHMPIAYCHPSLVDHDTTAPSVMASRKSQHPVLSERRDHDRHAWVLATDHVWDSSTCEIPSPRL